MQDKRMVDGEIDEVGQESWQGGLGYSGRKLAGRLHWTAAGEHRALQGGGGRLHSHAMMRST